MVHMEENGSSTKNFKISKGQRNGNPQAALAVLLSKREKLNEELKSVEKQVYDMETTYLHDSSQCGSVLKGFEAYLSSSKNAGNLKRSRKFQPEDRLFSLSSVTSPAVEENNAGRENDGRPEGTLGRNKSGVGLSSNGPGKQAKRGRTVPREGKRIKQGNEQEPEEDEDLDLVPR
ncbi:chromatin modification-related protein EAF6 [Marchantia polymorpha subsp. ruderalis]|uniref:Chromatin modification-related protein MEAF6 n=1 Tax=Marchantia polymorpha TaxID=3197 RepID=A0A2R6WVA6_MARPO|nr:hypothetical protein MARPO_0055s0054 [Marchantia polymorpha]BBN03009.1 hypothetical protein Mp_2g19960 [Marchantia polymorpha subsp. ruderalis]PTQ37779.1 hypothetical protein MARPO_0055s0054 [Marchantia polymorpha]PTQ37780.1 hypothetical protein MARPO_0055s0054 [Marchantia polymorpha]BBN03010.1 hypothetical protein Mp_2g19960 [Marchantia polymorpha subsp. ruderalis]|eukprot:PTQ37778.1 hypothetical protein MARPO_0055s0054 [Marchantia polymorpha]